MAQGYSNRALNDIVYRPTIRDVVEAERVIASDAQGVAREIAEMVIVAAATVPDGWQRPGIPTDPLIIEITDEERAALIATRGGYSTTNGSDEGRMFESLEDRGLVKAVTIGTGATWWKLSGDGRTIAYGSDPS